jgi:hypothetical protein
MDLRENSTLHSRTTETIRRLKQLDQRRNGAATLGSEDLKTEDGFISPNASWMAGSVE